MNIKFTETIYATHDDWGNQTEYLDRDDMEKCIKSLRDLGEEWKSISISDCRVYKFEKKLGGRQAEYHERYNRKYGPHVFEKNKDGSYRMVS